MSLFSDVEIAKMLGFLEGYTAKKGISRITVDFEYCPEYIEDYADEDLLEGIDPEVYDEEPDIDDVVDNAVAIAEKLIAECQVPNVPDPVIYPEPELSVAPVEPETDEPVAEGAEEVPTGTVSPSDETEAAEGDIPVITFIPPYLTDVIEGDYTGSLPLGQSRPTPEETMKPEPLEGDLVAVQTYGQPESAPVIEEAQEPKKPEEVATEPDQTVDAVVPVPHNVTGAEMQPEEPKAEATPEELLATYGQFAPQAKPEEVAAIVPEVLGTEVVSEPDHIGEPSEPEVIVPVEVLTKEVEAQVEHPPEETDAVNVEDIDPDLSEADYEVEIDKEPDTSEIKVARKSRKKAA